MYLEILFWILLFILFYTYLGYLFFLMILSFFKNIFIKKTKTNTDFFPEITIFVTAYNEQDYIEKKIKNTKSLNYPHEKIRQLWVIDGSTDKSCEILKNYPEITVLSEPERKGKITAMNRGIDFVKTPITIFTDANTILAPDSVKNMVKHFTNPKVACVAGKKIITTQITDIASSSGESFYWKIESLIKKYDSELGSVVGVAGELFAIRTNNYTKIKTDSVIEDFVLSLEMVRNGFIVRYEPNAVAMEQGSFGIAEEYKRKVRIAAGAFQTLKRYLFMLNIFQYRFFSFQFFSHKILRWTIAPLALITLYPLNYNIIHKTTFFNTDFYRFVFFAQCFFYLCALLGWLIEKKRIKLKIMFIPLYFCLMNISIFAGFVRFISRKQKVTWEKSRRIV